MNHPFIIFWAAALLICSFDFCFGMGSGPHPHLLMGIPAPTNAPGSAQGLLAPVGGGEGLWLILSTAAAGFMIAAFRFRKKA